MKIHAKIWLETDEGELLVGEGRLKIFRTIEKTGSLSATAREMNMSYRALWGKVRATEKRMGIKIIESTAGGHKRGGTQLTDQGKAFVSKFEEFDKRARRAIIDLSGELLDGMVTEVQVVTQE
jgi:molybdate transport system regulatory protein